MVTVLVKNNLRRLRLSTTKTMTEDKLEGTGLPAHGLVILDVSWVLALPLYLYMLSLGVKTWSKNLLKVGFTRKARVLLGLQDQTPGFPVSVSKPADLG